MRKFRRIDAAGVLGCLRVEHLHRRGTVRVEMGERPTSMETVVEIGIEEFIDRLGLAPLAEPVAFLVFAGNSGCTTGGAGDLVGSFSGEEKARECFASVCQESSPDWAQLLRVEATGQVTVVCWRGTHGGAQQAADLGAQGHSGGTRLRPAVVVPLSRRSRALRWPPGAVEGSD